MKALEKDRTRRYETANDLAMDVQRYLADEPVLACPPSLAYRLRKFVRRNRPAVSIAAMALLTFALLGAGAGWLLRDRDARQAQLFGQFDLIMDEVKQRQAEQKWPEALAAARRAEMLVAASGGNAELERRIQDVLAGLKLVERLKNIRLERDWRIRGRIANEWASEAYAETFRDAGIAIAELEPEESARRLRARPELVLPFAAALDDWASCHNTKSDADRSTIVNSTFPGTLQATMPAASMSQPITPLPTPRSAEIARTATAAASETAVESGGPQRPFCITPSWRGTSGALAPAAATWETRSPRRVPST
jgi:hypothetical protein